MTATVDLVIVRHGQSAANAAGTIAGWRDVPLTARGVEEAAAAGRLLRRLGIPFAAVFTSMLQRATATADRILGELGIAPPRTAHWRLNERHYGALQGGTRADADLVYGRDASRAFRRQWNSAPPPADASGTDDPRSDPRYAHVAGDLPRTESLADMTARVDPVWDELRPLLSAGRPVLIVAHNLSLRALIRPLEGVTAEGLPDGNLGNALPRRYRLDAALRPLIVDDATADGAFTRLRG